MLAAQRVSRRRGTDPQRGCGCRAHGDQLRRSRSFPGSAPTSHCDRRVAARTGRRSAGASLPPEGQPTAHRCWSTTTAAGSSSAARYPRQPVRGHLPATPASMCCSVDYRLAPEHKAPAAVDDAYAAYLWAREHAAELGADAEPGRRRRGQRGRQPRRGGGAACARRRRTAAGAAAAALPDHQLRGPDAVDRTCSPTGSSFAAGIWTSVDDKYLGGSGIDPADPRVSPLLADDLSGLPPALLVTAGFDPLRDEGRQYAEALRAAGNAGGRPRVRFADPRLRQLLRPRRRQRDGDLRDHLGAARPSEPQRDEPRGRPPVLLTRGHETQEERPLRPEGRRPQAQPVDPDRVDRDRGAGRRRAGALHRDGRRQEAGSRARPSPIRVASSKLITKEGTTEPKAVVSLYEDFLCPHCGEFEQQFGPTINKLIDSGAVAADYYMVAILDSPSNENYSSRAGGAAYCVADESNDAFRRFHAALYAQQPGETGAASPTTHGLIEVARQAGAGGGVPDCINKGRYVAMVQGLAQAPRHPVHADHPDQRPGLRHHRTRRPTSWSPRSRKSSATCPGLTTPRRPAPNPTPRRWRRDRDRADTPGRARRPARRGGASRCAPPARCGC